ncbi:asparaginase [Ornithinibacillus sp. 4-3]|uniref:asparaginase n=1 Tax=Ornithinibacillus sp. 4-3 TaxID=3231488 RepID=A0AB39HSX5_9BACI
MRIKEAFLLKKILLLTTGGTISGAGSDRLDLKDYKAGNYSGEYFLEQVPEIKQYANVIVEHVDNIVSTAIQNSHWITLRDRITKAFHSEDFDGVVITHGTNTMEETAYFLHLTVPSEKPIVLVGSQRPFTAISSDGPINLLHAVRVAASDEAYGKGALVVMNDEINGAREVTKTNTYRLETFQSGQHGFLGFVEPDNSIQFYRAPTRKHTAYSDFADVDLTDIPAVEIVYSYAGVTGDLIRYITESGKYKGIVVAGTGAGTVSPAEEEALLEAKEKGIYIVRCSRLGNGRVASMKSYEKLNPVIGDNLLVQKARILLMLSLIKYDNVEDIQKIFDTH